MTVAELIAKLQEMPPDTVVIYSKYSEFTEMDEKEIIYLPFAAGKPHPDWAPGDRLIKHDEIYMLWNPRYKKPDDPEPEFVSACVFPGN